MQYAKKQSILILGGLFAIAVAVVSAPIAAQPTPLFSGNNSYVSLDTPDALQIAGGAQFTIEGWILFQALSERDMLYSKNSGRSTPYTYMFGLLDNGTVMAAYTGNGGTPRNTWREIELAVPVSTGRWHHLAFSFDGSVMSYYLDGVLQGTNGYQFANYTAHTIQIGGYHANSDISGSKSDIRVWDHARSETTIRALMTCRLTGSEPGLLGYWPLDEGEGTVAADLTLNGNHGTIYNIQWDTDACLPVAGPFAVAHPQTGSTRFTNSNKVDVVSFPWHSGYAVFQITENLELPVDDPTVWTVTNEAPLQWTFSGHHDPTQIVLTAWFTNQTEQVALVSNLASIVFTTEEPQARGRESFEFMIVEGVSEVVLAFSDIDDGTSGGMFDGDPIPFVHALGCEWDTTPEEPFVTLTTGGVYEVLLSVTNAAGSVAAATSLVTVLTREPRLYVSPEGDDSVGASWSNAFHALPDALAVALPGDTIHVAGRVFAIEPQAGSAVTWSDATNIVIRGDYQALPDLPYDQHPGARDGSVWPTILERSGSESGRILTLSGLRDCVIEGMTLRNGFRNPGHGVLISDSSGLVFSDCRIIENGARSGNLARGGGIEIANGAVILTNCLIADNLCHTSYVNGPRGGGGGISVRGGATVTVIDSAILNNQARGYQDGYPSFGGGIDVDTGGDLTLIRCRIIGNQVSSGTSLGGAIANYGTIRLRNCLVVSNQSATLHSDGIWSSGAAAQLIIDNCTVADNNNGIGIRYQSGSISLTNSIVWGHQIDLMDFPADPEGRLPDVRFSCIGDGQNSGYQGCHSVDPLFADRVTYHLQSTQGHYTNGYFSGGQWTLSAMNSPLIDRGDPSSEYSLEPAPNGGRINMGAYGNTETAARTASVMADLPEVINPGAQLWGHHSALLRGSVIVDGGQLPETGFEVWQQGGPVTSVVWVGLRDGDFSGSVSGLTSGSAYFYRALASNQAGIAYSAPSPFVLHAPASTLYVATNGNNTAGTNWATAYSDLNAALQIAGSGDTVLLAGHRFGGSPAYADDTVFRWTHASNVTVRGGYEASLELPFEDHPGPRDPDIWPSILERESGHGRVLTMAGISNALVEQVTFRNGSVSGGGLFLAACGHVTFRGCRIVDNVTDNHGGGIHLANSTAIVLDDCRISRNEVRRRPPYGGGLYVDNGSRLIVRRSIIDDNLVYNTHNSSSSHGFGGGIWIASGGEIEVWESILQGNRATTRNSGAQGYGGAMINYGSALLRNTLVISNQSQSLHSDGILTSGAAAYTVIENCTIADNQSGTGIGVRCDGGTTAMTNTIVWGHQTDLLGLAIDGDGRLIDVAYSLFAIPADMHGIHFCITNNPAFINPGNGDYRFMNNFGLGHPSLTSPAIDAGINAVWMHQARDLDGHNRIMPGRLPLSVRHVDMGAYESLPPRGSMYSIR